MIEIGALEWAANGVTAAAIVLAARNHVLTWPLGIVGCALFAWQFGITQLYADVTLQLFFIASSIWGWRHWLRGAQQQAVPVTRAQPRQLAWGAAGAVLITVGYGGLLHAFTNAWMPFLDAAVLGLSVVAQLLLMQRKLENWPVWLMVNTLAVPLFASRGLWLTAVLYGFYWFNAWYGWWHWRRQMPQTPAPAA